VVESSGYPDAVKCMIGKCTTTITYSDNAKIGLKMIKIR
jgi:hypothetical protein